jgi:hypothetical protein
VCDKGGMEAMANTIPNVATGSKATPLHRAFIREMLMAQDVEGYVANCQAIGEFVRVLFSLSLPHPFIACGGGGGKKG